MHAQSTPRRHHRRVSIPERFWSRVDQTDPSGCWLWTGHRNQKGYGTIAILTSKLYQVRAHRLAWELASGTPVPAGLKVLHVCDDRACVRNDEPGVYEVNGQQRPRYGHLFLGTAADNNADMIAKGRARLLQGGPFGEANYFAKLSAREVLEMRARHAAGASCRRLAAAYGTSPDNVRAIVRRASWAHLPNLLPTPQQLALWESA
jgi:hypothetical protein